MMKILSFLTAFLLVAQQAVSQDGKLLSQTPYTVTDSSVSQWEKIIPDIRALLNTVEFFSITYLSDGLKVKGYLAVPKKEGKYPVIIYNRGGNRESSAIGDGQLIRVLGTAAGWGYVCLGSQYRGNGGGEGKEEFGGKDVNDILNLLPCLPAIEKADTSRIGMWGWSRGGMMTYLALTKTTRIKAAVVGSGMADAFIQTRKRHEMDTVFAQLAPGYQQNRDSVLRARSAVYWADKICTTTPLLLLTGSADWRVSPEEQFEMLHRLVELNHPVRFEFFEGGQHSLSEYYDEVNHAIKTFLDTYVRDKKQTPSLEPHGK